uniref:PH domain-containing protein n=1 Tax=Syphacia muris TaxID=451379 RepID=A0A158R643_9BILA
METSTTTSFIAHPPQLEFSNAAEIKRLLIEVKKLSVFEKRQPKSSSEAEDTSSIGLNWWKPQIRVEKRLKMAHSLSNIEWYGLQLSLELLDNDRSWIIYVDPQSARMSPSSTRGGSLLSTADVVTTEKAGWLQKWTNYIRGYRQRWFVLDSHGILSYYRSRNDGLKCSLAVA